MDLLISKPKKRENGTYTSSVFYKEKSQKFHLRCPSAVVVSKKDISEAEQYIYVKCKHIKDTIYDLNKDIIEIVKDNCVSWFKNNLQPELIDEYFVSTLVYDKKYGDLIRLKCIDMEADIPIKKYLNMELTLTNIRFYKQKFVFEWVVTSVEEFQDFCEEERNNSDDEDAPVPDYDDMNQILDEYVCKVEEKLHDVSERIKKCQEEKVYWEDILARLKQNMTEEHFLTTCDLLQKILE